jgi:hypothetical protein
MRTAGIVTMPRAISYGAILQSYALHRTIAEMGYECELIDYVYPNEFHFGSSFQARAAWKKRLRSLVRFLCLTKKLDDSRIRRFDDFRKKHIALTDRAFGSIEELLADPPLYDAYVTGSDQVWNPKFVLDDPCFFLQFAPKDRTRVAYAASFAVSQIPIGFHEKYRKYIDDIDFLSVREDSGVALVKKLTGRSCDLVLDPIFLVDEKGWDEVSVPFSYQMPYLVCYCLGTSRYVRSLCQHIATIKGYSIVHIWPQPYERFKTSVHSIYDAGPSEFVGILQNASFVVTNSYHGTAFAANFGKPFFSVRHDFSLDSRQSSLLRLLRVEERGLELGDPFPSEEQLEMEFDWVEAILAEKRRKSISYLRDALG